MVMIHCILYILSIRRQDHASGVQLTGDSQADADIIAFMRARQNLLKSKGMSL